MMLSQLHGTEQEGVRRADGEGPRVSDRQRADFDGGAELAQHQVSTRERRADRD